MKNASREREAESDHRRWLRVGVEKPEAEHERQPSAGNRNLFWIFFCLGKCRAYGSSQQGWHIELSSH